MNSIIVLNARFMTKSPPMFPMKFWLFVNCHHSNQGAKAGCSDFYVSVHMCLRHMLVGLCTCVCICMYLYVCNSDFSKVTKNHASAGKCSTGTAQQYLGLNSLRFLNKSFVHFMA